MKIAVIDLGYGDSGKGTVVAFLCHHYKNSIVVRYSGGQQAGHTVVHNGIRHVFSSFGSGTLQGVPTFWSSNCTFYPNGFLGELQVLKEKGITPKIYVHGKCPVTTFVDIRYNKSVNELTQHGSCGAGFGATLEREENHYSILVEDLNYPWILEKKLKLLLENHYRYVPYSDEDVYNFMLDCCDVLNNITIVEDDKILDKYTNIIFEGSQGLLLDKDIGFFPHVTRGNVGSKAIESLGYRPDIVCYVTRAYQTRHGNGPMTNEDKPHEILENENETNVENYQGVFRRTLLDLDLLKYSLQKDATSSPGKLLFITCMDHIKNDLRFTYKGQVLKCVDENIFVKEVSSILGFDTGWVSHSDEYINIKNSTERS